MAEPKVEPIVEPTVEPNVEPVVEPVVEPKEDKTKTRNKVLRELSEEFGVNLFEAEGLEQFKKFTDSQKTATEKLEAELEIHKSKEAEWQAERLEYKAKLKASELGIKQDALEDALKLAGGDPDKLPDVLKKYPIFKSTDGVRIGVQDPSGFHEPKDSSEVEAYMANDPLYKKWNKSKKL